MRYRYSIWDPVFVFLMVGVVVVGLMALRASPESIPLHFNIAGEPDRWGEPSAMLLIGMPLLLLGITYPALRIIDLVFAARNPEKYGFMTNMGGGTAIGMMLLGFIPHVRIFTGYNPGIGVIFSVMALLYVYMGVLFLITPPERISWNMQGGAVATPEGRASMARGMGWGFIAGGVAMIPLAFLPGELSMLSIIPLSFGPIAGMGIGMAKAPKPSRK